MMRKTFSWNHFRSFNWFSERWVDRVWTLGLLLTALLLFGIHLGDLPLQDWDEGIVAQVARDIWRSPWSSQTWLYPTLAGEPYLHPSPFVPWLIALTYHFGGVNEWTTRLPGATLTAISIPLLYSLGRELFPSRIPALFAALIYLTSLPIARLGRLAMPDGPLLCFFVLMILCLLRMRRDLRWGLGVGITVGCLYLIKGDVALLLSAIAIVFIILDTPRLLTSGYVWIGVLLGIMPALAWYGAQWLHYGEMLLQLQLSSPSMSRIWSSVETHPRSLWFYLLKILEYSIPWILFLPQGFQLAWENRNLGWARLVLVWSGGCVLVLSVMSTKFLWHVLPIYPALALVVGIKLADVWNSGDVLALRQAPRPRYPIAWTVVLAFLAIASWASSVYFSEVGTTPQLEVQIILSAVAMTMTIATILVFQRDIQFIPVLFWGSYVSLLLLMSSHQWVWELTAAYEVKPVAEMIQRSTPPGTILKTSYPSYRPSLSFYSDRQVFPASAEGLKVEWQKKEQQPYLLVDAETAETLNLKSLQQLGQAEGWVVVTRKAEN